MLVISSTYALAEYFLSTESKYINNLNENYC